MKEHISHLRPYSATDSPIARIIIVCFDSLLVLPRCLAHLEAQTRADFEVFIVNNKPKDVAVQRMTLPDSRFRVLEPDENLGFAQGSNFGAEGAQTEWVITLNPDAFPAPDWFEHLMAGAARNPKAAGLGSAMISAHDPSTWDGLGDCYSIYGVSWRGGQGWSRDALAIEDSDRPILSPCGAAAAFRTSIFQAQGGFDPEYFCYLEDMDLGLRLVLAGHEIVLISRAEVLHLGGESTAKEALENSDFGSEFAIYHSHRNAVRLMIKTMPVWLLPTGGAAFLLGQIWLLIRKARQPHAAFQRKGLIAGLRHFPSHWRARKSVQDNRRISALDFARKISWSAKSLKLKSPDFYTV